MKNEPHKSCFCLLILLLLALVSPVGAVVDPPCGITLEPDVTYVHPGDVFTVTVRIDPHSVEVYGLQCNVSFDPTTFKVMSQSQGSFLSSDGQRTYMVPKTYPEKGVVLYAESRYGVKTGVSAPGVASTIQFKVNDTISSYGIKEFLLDNVLIVDSNLLFTSFDSSTGTVVLMEPVVSDFTANVTEGETPLTVGFTDTSMNAVSWHWDFNGDSLVDSGVQNPEYTYNEPGKYAISLTVANELGTNDTSTKTITVYGVPVSDFTTSITESEAPLTVKFTDASTNAVSWSWDFDGDGSVDSEVQNPEYTYAEPGEYIVSLTVANELGTIDTEKEIITVKSQPVDEPPVINSVNLFPANTIPGTTIHVNVDAMDELEVIEVNAGDVSLVKTDGIWQGSITAPNELGDYSLSIIARDAVGNTAETSVPYHVVRVEGGASISVSPRFSRVSAGNDVSLTIKVKNTQNIDDIFNVRINTDRLPESYSANLADFSWTENEVKLRAGEEKVFPLEVNVPAETAPGYKFFRANLNSETTSIYGISIGYLRVY